MQDQHDKKSSIYSFTYTTATGLIIINLIINIINIIIMEHIYAE